MRARVVAAFRDKITKQLYTVGSFVELTDMVRVEDLTKRGLIQPVKEAKPEPIEEPEADQEPVEKPKKKAARRK